MNTFLTAPMRAPRRSLLALAALLSLATLLAGCHRSTAATAAEAAASAASAAASGAAPGAHAPLQLDADELARAGVKTETVQPAQSQDAVTVTATIKPDADRYARIAPRVEGRLVSVSANLGDTVRAGQVLATLDSVAVGEAQSAYRQALAAHRVAEADHQRSQRLAAEEIIAQRDLLRARAELEKSDAELAAAKDRLRLLGATVGDKAGSVFTLRSPIAGTVVERHATPGALVTPADAVLVVADLSQLWIEANLTEDMLARVKRGAPAQVTVGAYPGERFPGTVVLVGGVMDKDTHTVPARIEVPNRDGRLKPEMFASAEIGTGAARPAAISVPDGALVLLQGQQTVFVRDGQGFDARAVEVGPKVAGRTEIRSGLRAGDVVVVAGTYALKARLLKSQISED